MRRALSSVTPPRTTAAWSQPRRRCYCTADAQLVREIIRGGQKDAVEHVNVSPMTVDMEEEATGVDACKIN